MITKSTAPTPPAVREQVWRSAYKHFDRAFNYFPVRPVNKLNLLATKGRKQGWRTTATIILNIVGMSFLFSAIFMADTWMNYLMEYLK